MPERLEIRTLGGLRILVDGSPVRGLASRKAEALLVFLACQGGAPSRESLATLLWDDRTSSGSLANLSVLLSSLRKDLAPYLRIDRETVSLDPGSPWTCDAGEFERQVTLSAADDVDLPQAEADRIERALELYRGPFLEGFFVRQARGFEEWSAVQRERFRMQAVEGHRSLAVFGLHHRQYRRGQQHVQSLLNLDPLSEAGHRTAMLLYARQGEMALGLAQYQTCRDLLQTELGVDPSFETTDLYYRLRTAAENRVRNLPAPPTALVGRGEELEKLGAQLIDPGCRLLTLVGPGGIGKTRLAIRAAARAEADFLHGVCFVTLGAVDRPDQLVPAVAGALQMTFRPGSEMRGQLIGYLRDRELLLVLDNLEHLAESASLLGELLAAAPAVRLMVTSRTPLRMLGERVLEVQGLPYSEAGDAAGKTSAAEELFVQSAVRARSGFTLAEGDLAWVRKICRRVDGLPLALEMAGAWTSAYGVREVAEEVERSLDFLGGAYGDLPERQRSLRAVFEHSWSRLSAAEQERYRRLSVFRGGFSLEAARAVAEAGPADLASLVDKSLLHRPRPDRFQAHEVLRVYATEKAAEDPDGGPAVMRRFRSYFAGQLQRTEDQPTGRTQSEALADLAEDLENIRSAWRSACLEGDLEAVDRSLDGLFRLYMIRGLFQEGAEGFELAAQELERGGPQAATARRKGRLLARAAVFRGELSQYEAARTMIEASWSLQADLGDQDELVFLLNRRGILERKLGHFAEARSRHEDGLALARAQGSARRMADSYNTLATIDYYMGNFQAAREGYQAALDLFRQLGDEQQAGRCMINLANLADGSGDLDQAGHLYQESLTTAKAIGDRWGVAAAINNLGNVALAREEYREARRLYAESLAIKRELGHQEGIAASLDNLGRAAFGLNELAEAKRMRQASLSLRREIQDQWGMANSLSGLGEIAVVQGDYVEAEERLREALQLASEIGVPLLIESGVVGWAEKLLKQGEMQASLEMVAVVVRTPAKDKLTRARAVRVREGITAALPLAVVRAVERRAARRSMEGLVQSILKRDPDPGQL